MRRRAIRVNAEIGAKVVWFPAMDAKWCRDYLKREGGIRILNEDGTLRPEVYDILKWSKSMTWSCAAVICPTREHEDV